MKEFLLVAYLYAKSSSEITLIPSLFFLYSLTLVWTNPNKYLLSLAKEQIRLAFKQAEKEVENINLVTPTSYAPQIIEAIKIEIAINIKIKIKNLKIFCLVNFKLKTNIKTTF